MFQPSKLPLSYIHQSVPITTNTVQIPFRRGVLDTTLCNKVSQIEPAVILVIMYLETYKTIVISFCLLHHYVFNDKLTDS
jgi:hypothetical protein